MILLSARIDLPPPDLHPASAHPLAQYRPAHADNIPRHQFKRAEVDPFSIAFHRRLDRKLGLKCCNGIARLMFFPESDHGIGKSKTR
jgi:hypothetical protein